MSRGPNVAMGRALDRRRFLRAAGVAIGLPLLDSMTPAFAAAVFAAAAQLETEQPAFVIGSVYQT